MWDHVIVKAIPALNAAEFNRDLRRLYGIILEGDLMHIVNAVKNWYKYGQIVKNTKKVLNTITMKWMATYAA